MRSRLRVIAGTLRGAHLNAPSEATTRPITDKVKESLFNILGHRFGTLGELPPVDVLDLFAGSGSMGIEALSRGARRCTFVERDRRAVRVLRGNIERTRLAERATVLCENAWAMRLPSARPPSAADADAADASRASAAAGSLRPGSPTPGFGIVFADPPYRDAKNAIMVADLLDRIAARLAPAGVAVFRHGPDADPPRQTPAGLVRLDHRTFKQMHVLIYGWPPASELSEGDDATAAPSPA